MTTLEQGPHVDIPMSNLLNLSRRELRKVSFLLLILALSIVYLYELLFEAGLPDGADAMGNPMLLSVHYRNSDWFSSWWPYHTLGHIEIPSGWLFLFYMFLMQTLRDAVVATRVIVFITFIVGALSAFFLANHLCKNDYASFLSSLFYTFNPWILGEYAAGHYGVCMGYSLLPLVFLAYDRAMLNMDFISAVFAAFVATGLTMVHQHFLIYSLALLAPLTLIYLVKYVIERKIIAFGKTFLTVASLTFFFSATYSLPNLLLAGNIPILSFRWPINEYINGLYSSQNFLKALMLDYTKDFDGRSYRLRLLTSLGLSNIQTGVALLFPVLAFSALSVKRDRYVLFFSASALFSAFLATSYGSFRSYPPPLNALYNVYPFLYDNVPAFSTFRVARRFLAITAFSYSSLMAISLPLVCERLSTSWQKLSKKTTGLSSRHYLKGLAVIAIVFVIILNSWWGFGESPFNNFVLPDSYESPFRWIAGQNGDFRVATLPFDVPDIFNHTLSNGQWFYRSRDFGYYSVGITGKGAVYYYPDDMGAFPLAKDFLRFINNTISDNKTRNILRIIGPVASVRYVVYQTYADGKQRDFFLLQEGVKIIDEYETKENELIMENPFWKPRIYATQSYAIVFGKSDPSILRAFSSLVDLNGFSLEDMPLIFNQSIFGSQSYRDLVDNAGAYIFYNTGSESTLNGNARFVFIFDFEQRELEERIYVPRAGKYALIVKSSKELRRGNIIVNSTLNLAVDFKRQETGVYEGQVGPFSLNEGYYNLSVPALNEVYQVILFSMYADEENPSAIEFSKRTRDMECTYQKIGLNRYTLHIKSQQPLFIVFTDAYSPLWRVHLDNASIQPTVTNYFSNGFFIKAIGEHDVILEFSGQKIIEISLAISVSSAIATVVYTLFRKRRAIATSVRPFLSDLRNIRRLRM